jgi:hypothetical protein
MGNKRQSVSELKADTSSLQQEIQALRQKLEHQNRLMKSIWNIIKQQHDLDDSELEAMMRTVTEKANQKSDTAEACKNCARPLQDNSPICIYCGAKHNHQHLF